MDNFRGQKLKKTGDNVWKSKVRQRFLSHSSSRLRRREELSWLQF